LGTPYAGAQGSVKHEVQPTKEKKMGNIGPPEIILLLLLALLLFGAKRLPEIGRSLGTGMREFKDSVTGDNRPEPSQIAQRPIGTLDTTAAVPARENETVG
jgi:sec-independent protein translocase protein TatA